MALTGWFSENFLTAANWIQNLIKAEEYSTSDGSYIYGGAFWAYFSANAPVVIFLTGSFLVTFQRRQLFTSMLLRYPMYFIYFFHQYWTKTSIVVSAFAIIVLVLVSISQHFGFWFLPDWNENGWFERDTFGEGILFFFKGIDLVGKR